MNLKMYNNRNAKRFVSEYTCKEKLINLIQDLRKIYIYNRITMDYNVMQMICLNIGPTTLPLQRTITYSIWLNNRLRTAKGCTQDTHIQRLLQNTHSHRTPHSHYNRHENNHASYTYIYCLYASSYKMKNKYCAHLHHRLTALKRYFTPHSSHPCPT